MKNQGMTRREAEEMLDEVLAGIRAEGPGEETIEAVASRVREQLIGGQGAVEAGAAVVEHLRGCEDFQALVPHYIGSRLTVARTMLFEDHMRECVPCRRALREARQAHQGVAAEGRRIGQRAESGSQRLTARSRRLLAVAAVLLIGIGLWPAAKWLTASLRGFEAVVEAADGSVYRASNQRSVLVRRGERLQAGERLRTARGASAVVRLSDGTAVELQERSALTLAREVRGVTVHLERGEVVVEAVGGKEQPIYVETADALVAASGTVLSVNRGTKGARLSVVDGEASVTLAGRSQLLHPGDQLTTHRSIEPIPVQDEVSWSRNAEKYRKLLDQAQTLRGMIEKQISMPGNRYSTRLLDLMPERLSVYVAIPNLGPMLTEAERLVSENVAGNSELKEWWDREQAASNHRQGIDKVLEFARLTGDYLGDEIAFGVEVVAGGAPAGGSAAATKDPSSGDLLLLAELRDRAGLRSFIEQQIAENGGAKSRVVIVDDPASASAIDGDSALYLWIGENLIAASPRPESLRGLARRLDAGSFGRGASGGAFHDRIAELYREGAGLLIAADLESLVSKVGRGDGKEPVRQLGLTNLRHFIVELKEKDGRAFNRAVVSFENSGHGVTSWLARPAPMGALQFISPNASIVAAFIVSEPTAIVDDLLGTLKTTDPQAWENLRQFQAAQGIDLRNDLAAPLGGEYALAIDGPLLPLPAWRAIFEVDDPERLQQTLDTLVDRISERLKSEGKLGFTRSSETVGSLTLYKIKSLDYGLEVDYAFANGYVVAGPSRAAIEKAIGYQESGNTLLGSAKFQATLPADRQANFSAMLFNNLGKNLNSIARPLAGALAGSRAGSAASSLLDGKAGLAYAYALDDRLIFSVNSEDGPIGISPADFLGLPGSTGIGGFLRELRK